MSTKGAVLDLTLALGQKKFPEIEALGRDVLDAIVAKALNGDQFDYPLAMGAVLLTLEHLLDVGDRYGLQKRKEWVELVKMTIDPEVIDET